MKPEKTYHTRTLYFKEKDKWILELIEKEAEKNEHSFSHTLIKVLKNYYE